MHILKYNSTIKRFIRQDTPADLGISTRAILEAAVKEGRTREAQEWLDYFCQEVAGIQDILSVWSWYLVQYILERMNDADWETLLKESMAPWLGMTAALPNAPIAHVQVGDLNSRLSLPGLSWIIHITSLDHRFHITLDSPEAQQSRRSRWRSDIGTTIEMHQSDTFSLLLSQRIEEDRLLHDILCDWVWALLTVIAREWGEESLGEVQRQTEEPWIKVRYEAIQSITPDESLQLSVEAHRGHFSGPNRDGSLTVIDEPERYVIRLEECGSGARMIRGDSSLGTVSRLEHPYNFINIQGAYDWTWKRTKVGGYCSHCAIVNQILPIEWLGRPMRGTKHPDQPDQPCEWYIYKSPAAIPEETFTSVGKQPNFERDNDTS